MKRLIAVAIALLIMEVACYPQNIEHQIIASQYGTWQVPGYAPDSYSFQPTQCRVQGGASFFDAFTVGTPIWIKDGNPSLSELVTPTYTVETNDSCSITVAPQNSHNLPFYLTSGTGGLQEALNTHLTDSVANTIILDAIWHKGIGTRAAAVIAAAQGNANLGLVDVTTTPSTWYQWNGTQYVAVQIGGGVNSITATLPITVTTGTAPNVACPTCNAQYGWSNNLGVQQGVSDTVITLGGYVGNYPSQGTFIVDSEWETYTGVNAGAQQLTGITRGAYATTPTAHNTTGTLVASVVIPFAPTNQLPYGSISGYGNGTGSAQEEQLNCLYPSQHNNAGGLPALSVNCQGSGYETDIDTLGSIHQYGLSSSPNFMGPIYIGTVTGQQAFGIGQPIPITNTTNLVQTNGAYQLTQPIGLASGVAGAVISTQVPTIPAPNAVGQTGGSCSITYEIAGTDIDGNGVPGTTVTLTGLSFPSAGIVYIQGGLYAGVVTSNVYRTAVSGCGSTITTGKFTASSSAQYPLFQDTGGAGDGTTPPATNMSLPKVCVNGQAYCELAGPSSTPSVACSTSIRSWMWHNTSAVATPFALVCNGTNWVTAF